MVGSYLKRLPKNSPKGPCATWAPMGLDGPHGPAPLGLFCGRSPLSRSRRAGFAGEARFACFAWELLKKLPVRWTSTFFNAGTGHEAVGYDQCKLHSARSFDGTHRAHGAHGAHRAQGGRAPIFCSAPGPVPLYIFPPGMLQTEPYEAETAKTRFSMFFAVVCLFYMCF